MLVLTNNNPSIKRLNKLILKMILVALLGLLPLSMAMAKPQKADPTMPLFGFSELGIEQAKIATANAKRIENKSIDDWMKEGWAAFKSGKAPDATIAFNRAWLLDHKNPAAFVGLAAVEEALKQNPDQAQKLLELGTQANPKDAYLLSQYAQFYFRQRDGQNCVLKADAALAAQAETGEAWWVRAKCLAAMRREIEAAAAFDRALPLMSDQPDFVSDYGSYFVLRDKPMKAREALEPAFQAYPEHTLLGLRYAQSLWATGNSKDACRVIGKLGAKNHGANLAHINQIEDLNRACKQP